MKTLLKNCRVCKCENLKIGDYILTKKGYVKIASIVSGGRGKCYDITLFKDKEELFMGEENFVLGNGVISHNCNLAIIQDCLDYVEQNRGIKVTRKQLEIDNSESIRIGSRNDLVGIFQFENPATKEIVDAVKMDSLNDIMAVTSLIRPGPRDMGMDKEYAERKHGRVAWKIPDCLNKVLSSTYGVMCYQEQIMLLAQILSGFTPAESNQLRKTLTKEKRPEVIESLKEKFINGAKYRIENGELSQSDVEQWWELVVAFVRYGFNKSHSASYSAISAVEFYLKHNFLKEYITALMNNTPEPAKYVNYARKHGLTILCPSINNSTDRFEIVDGRILYSLKHIKQIGGTVVSNLISRQPYSSFKNFLESLPKRQINRRVFFNLLYAGAFDEFGNRYKVMEEYYQLRKDEEERIRESKRKKPKKEGAKKTKKEESDEKSWEKIFYEHGDDRIWREKEVEVLGVCLSSKPILLEYGEMIREKKYCTIGDEKSRGATYVFGRISSFTKRTSRNGNDMIVVNLDDDIDTMKFYVWKNNFMHFNKNARIGYIGAFYLNKFEDGDVRFWDSKKEPEIIKK